MKRPFFNEGSEKRWITIFRLTSEICVQREPGKRNDEATTYSRIGSKISTIVFLSMERVTWSIKLSAKPESINLSTSTCWLNLVFQPDRYQSAFYLSYASIYKNTSQWIRLSRLLFYRPFEHYRPNS